MKLIASAAMKKVDTKAIGEMGIPEAVLIENAGRAVADAAKDLLEKRKKSLCSWAKAITAEMAWLLPGSC